MWPVQTEKDIWSDFFSAKRRIKYKSTIYYLNARLRKGGRPPNSAWSFHSYMGTDTLTFFLLGNSPHPLLVKSIWTYLRCICYASTQYGTEESVVMGCRWGLNWVLKFNMKYRELVCKILWSFRFRKACVSPHNLRPQYHKFGSTPLWMSPSRSPRRSGNINF